MRNRPRSSTEAAPQPEAPMAEQHAELRAELPAGSVSVKAIAAALFRRGQGCST